MSAVHAGNRESSSGIPVGNRTVNCGNRFGVSIGNLDVNIGNLMEYLFLQRFSCITVALTLLRAHQLVMVNRACASRQGSAQQQCAQQSEFNRRGVSKIGSAASV